MIENITQTTQGYRATIDGIEMFIPDAPSNRYWQMVQEALANGATISSEPQQDAATEVRSVRNQLLFESDWVVLRSLENTVPISTEWLTYRQSLRDISQQGGFPSSVQWPIKPE